MAIDDQWLPPYVAARAAFADALPDAAYLGVLDAELNEVELTRQAVTDADILFPAATGAVAAFAVAIFNEAGSALFYTPLAVPIDLETDDVLVFPAGSLTFGP